MQISDTDCWIRTLREKKRTVQSNWTITNFSRISKCNEVFSLPFKLDEYNSYFLKLYPNGKTSCCKEYISIVMADANSNLFVYGNLVYQISLVNINGDLENTLYGTYGPLERSINKFIERKVLLEDKNLILNDTISIHCSVSDCGDVVSEIWERNIYDENSSRDESADLLSKDLDTLRNDYRSTDVTLKGPSSPEIFIAHKDVLASRSSFFKRMFWDQSNLDDSRILELPKFCVHEICDPLEEDKTIKRILMFIYGNSLEDMSIPELRNVYCAGDRFDLKPLRNACLRVLMKDLDIDQNNLVELLEFARKHDDQQLQQHIYRYISQLPNRKIIEEITKKYLNAVPKFVAFFLKVWDSCSQQKVAKNQLPIDEHWETTVSTKSIIWSISDCHSFINESLYIGKTVNVDSPNIEITSGDCKFKIRCEFNYPEKSLSIALQSLHEKSPGRLKCEIFIKDHIGINRPTIVLEQDILQKEIIPSHLFSYEELENPDLTENGVLTLYCSTTAHITHEKKPVHSTLAQDMRSLFEDENRGDVTLRCDGQDFHVHKYVLCIRSTVFNAMLQHDTKEKLNSIVDIPDADVSSVKDMLLYIYAGIVDDLNEETATSLLKLADRYDVNGLKDLCLKYLSSRLSTLNVLDLLLLADAHSDERLKSAACELISFHAYEIFSSTEWSDFVEKHSLVASEVVNRVYLKKHSLVVAEVVNLKKPSLFASDVVNLKKRSLFALGVVNLKEHSSVASNPVNRKPRKAIRQIHRR